MRRILAVVLEVIGGAVFAALAGWFTLNYLQGYAGPIDSLIRLAMYTLSTVAGVFVAGEVVEQNGSFWFAFLGASLGGVVVWQVTGSRVGASNDLLTLLELFFTSLAIVGPILATIGYNLGLREVVQR